MNQDHVFYSSVDPAEGRKHFFLKGLDGLRAIAVALVLVYHLWPTALPGGMMGVDIFFVISGFLITALLLREGAFTGKMNIVQFWVRRARRLLPAIVVLVAMVGTLALLVGGDVKVGLGRQILGAFTFSSNWLYIASGNDYFAETSPELFTNFWSLAVEEQFYIFWPVILVFVFMLISRWRSRVLVPAVLALLSLGLAAALALVGTNPSRIYYGTDSHLFGLMLGVLLAFLIPWSMYPPADSRLYPIVGYGERWAGALRAAAGWLSLFAVLPLALVLNERSSFLMPWGLFLASLLAIGVIQALLADVHNPAANLLRAVLNNPVFVWLGKRSYGIYLWHWPLHVLSRYIFGAEASAWVHVLVLLLTLIIAGLSYMYVEEPVRRLGFRGALAAWATSMRGAKKGAPIAAAAALVLTGAATAAAVATAPTMTEAERVVADGAAAAHPGNPEGAVRIEPSDKPSEPADSPESEQATEPEKKTLAVSIIGDSVTLASADALQQALPHAVIDAQVSRMLVNELPALEEQAADGTLGDIVVISLSTNSTMSQQQVDETIKALSPHGERRLVFVTGQAPANLSWVEESNVLLRQAAADHPEVVFLADWKQASEGHPEYMVSDGVHPEAAGQKVYAQTIAQAVEKAAETMDGELPGDQPDQQADPAEGGAEKSSPSEEPGEPLAPATGKAW
ncbi:acyltransferase family protein [Rothia aerolata]|uniref:Acyltransferase 3 domain-containing protein n=1 Tax=Rothia aerolata TaxID=1812262 RepID=A0A917IUL1_9MICC|nr:acyltransferase family protein [Rothia aerolata]GGH63577.1 hypothetical protein GCM10007359_15010 [Rothia aerolata]